VTSNGAPATSAAAVVHLYLPELLREIGVEEPQLDAHVIALKPGHPYLRLPLQFSAALESRLLETLSQNELASLRGKAETELAEPGRWGTTFTLIQSWGCLETEG
jgi:hypothetical protein